MNGCTPMRNENRMQKLLMPQIFADYPDFIFFICVNQLFLRHLRSIYEVDAMSGCTPMRNENGTQTHLMHTDSRRLS